jgi:hypothetical protein
MCCGADKCCYNSARALVLLPNTRHEVETGDAKSALTSGERVMVRTAK